MQSQVSIEDSFQVLLFAGRRSRLAVLPHELLAVFQCGRTAGQSLTEPELERGISFLQTRTTFSVLNTPRQTVDSFKFYYSQILGEDSVLDELSGVAQTTSESVHGADVSHEQIFGVCRLPAYLSVEIQTAWFQTVLPRRQIITHLIRSSQMS